MILVHWRVPYRAAVPHARRTPLASSSVDDVVDVDIIDVDVDGVACVPSLLHLRPNHYLLLINGTRYESYFATLNCQWVLVTVLNIIVSMRRMIIQ